MHNYIKDTIFDKNNLNPVHLYVDQDNLFKIISQEGPQRLLFIENSNILCSAKATETIHEYMLQTLLDNGYIQFEELHNYRNKISKQYNMLIDNINNEEIDDEDSSHPLKLYSSKYYLIIRNVEIKSIGNLTILIKALPESIRIILNDIDIIKSYNEYINRSNKNNNILTIFKNSLSTYNIKNRDSISKEDLINNYNIMVLFISSIINSLLMLENNDINKEEFTNKFIKYFEDFIYHKRD